MKCEIAGAEFLADGVEVEVEAIDRVELGEPRVLDATVDGALHPVGTLVIAEAMEDVERGQVVLAGLLEQRGEELHHAVQTKRAQLLEEQVERVVIVSAFHRVPRR